MFFRRVLPFVVAFGCLGFALLTFDWSVVGRGLAEMRFGFFFVMNIPLALLAMAAAGLRWVSVAGLSFKARSIWRAYCYVAVSTAVAVVTPFQIGEAIKFKFARQDGVHFARSSLAYAMERVSDVAALSVMLAVGLAAHDDRGRIAEVIAAAAVVAVLSMPLVARRLAELPLPKRVSIWLVPLAEVKLSKIRLALLAGCTMTKWATTIGLWMVALESIGVHLTISQASLLVSVVTFAGIFSLVPGGIGVSEVSARAVLVWIGIETPIAETAAVALRLLYPLVILTGVAHVIGIDRRSNVLGRWALSMNSPKPKMSGSIVPENAIIDREI